jgi:hypothetical protein
MIEFIRKIEDLLRRVARLESLESSKIVYIPAQVRVLDDTTPRAAAYINSAVQVTGVTDLLGSGFTMPAKVSAVLLGVALIPTATGHASANIKNPVSASAKTAINGAVTVAGQFVAGTTLVTLNTSGQFYFQVNQAMNRTIWDVLAYIV